MISRTFTNRTLFELSPQNFRVGYINKEFFFQLANIKLDVDSLFIPKLHKKG
jgi:hypothetical protein